MASVNYAGIEDAQVAIFIPLPTRFFSQIWQNDSETNVKNRLQSYYAFSEELSDAFPEAQVINADQDPHTVFESIEHLIVNPIPTQFGRE